MDVKDMILADAIETAIEAEQRIIRLERTVAILLGVIFVMAFYLLVR